MLIVLNLVCKHPLTDYNHLPLGITENNSLIETSAVCDHVLLNQIISFSRSMFSALL